MSTLFFASLFILAAGLIGAISNMMAISISKGKIEMKDGRFIHSILMGVFAIGGLGSLVSGALWVAQYFKG